MPKTPRSITEQMQLLKNRGMTFLDENAAIDTLKSISYYRLKGYWWDMQSDRTRHTFHPDTVFETVLKRYNFDRHLRLILFDAIERIEIALRTKMIYHLSLSYGALWYRQTDLVEDSELHSLNLENLEREFRYSNEIFIVDHKRRFQAEEPEAWKILEIASMSTLSKLYKNLKHQLPEKSRIANEMGLNLHSELSSWLEAIVYIRNIIAHHSRIWSRNMVKRPTVLLNNPISDWFDDPLTDVQKKKPFLIISTLVYLCNNTNPENGVKEQILRLFEKYPDVPIYKLGFLNNWENQSLWR